MQNRNMKGFIIRIVSSVLFLGCLEGISAQIIHDPNDPLYRDIDRWAVQGYFNESLPFIRPYPAQVLDRLLNQVIDRGTVEDTIKATAYKKAVTTPERFIHAGIQSEVEGKDDDPGFVIAPFADGIVRLGDLVGASYAFFVYGISKDPGNEHNVPGTYSPYPDMVLDNASIGSFNIVQNWTSALAIGNADVYFQAGLNRNSFGPFYENGIVLGPQAGKAGHFSVNFRQPKWSFELLLLEISATDTLGNGQYTNKHLVLHSLNFRPFPFLELSFIESVVWGNRFEFLYVLPFNYLFAAQTMANFDDNSFLGFNVRWSAFRNAQILFQVYVDDLHFNDLIKFQLNTKYMLAGELGIVWNPKKVPLISLSADYTLVFPYTYTHPTSPNEGRYGDENNAPAVNYNNYTHLGRNLGPDLKPNSDRFSVRTRWYTIPGLELSASAYLTRHANASAGLEGMNPEWHKGDENDDGKQDNEPFDTNYKYLHFLTQDVIDTRLGSGIGVSWSLPVSFGVFSLNANCVLEYGWNRNVIKDNNGFNYYWSIGASFRW